MIEDLAEVSLLEIGPGRGDFLFDLARNNPGKRIGAIEIKKKRFHKLIRRIERQNLDNIRLILGDARVALPCLFDHEQIQKAYVLFSDPWPKKKHAKHRLFQPYFIHELYRVLKTSGDIVLAHDDVRYLEESQRLLLKHPGFCKNEVTLSLNPDDPELFQTFYAQKWREDGRDLHAYLIQKRPTSTLKKLKAFYQSGAFRTLWRMRKVGVYSPSREQSSL